jgi:hypothetical protein
MDGSVPACTRSSLSLLLRGGQSGCLPWSSRSSFARRGLAFAYATYCRGWGSGECSGRSWPHRGGCVHSCMATLLMCTLHMSWTGRACWNLAVQLIYWFKLGKADMGKSMYSSLPMLAVPRSGVACLALGHATWLCCACALLDAFSHIVAACDS